MYFSREQIKHMIGSFRNRFANHKHIEYTNLSYKIEYNYFNEDNRDNAIFIYNDNGELLYKIIVKDFYQKQLIKYKTINKNTIFTQSISYNKSGHEILRTWTDDKYNVFLQHERGKLEMIKRFTSKIML